MTPPTEGDLRWVAILSMDMVGFTELAQKLGPERVYEILRICFGIAQPSIERHGGHVVDTVGDGLMASFGAPVACEEASLRACQAAAEIRRALMTVSPTELEKPPLFRFGINGGQALVAHTGLDTIKVVGDPVNSAARLQALAEPGEIIITEAIRREAVGGLDVVPRGEQRLRGFPEPFQLFTLLNAPEANSRFQMRQRRGLVSLKARATELRQAVEVFDNDSNQSTLLLSGVAGIGKSRLAHEVAQELAPRPTFVGQCAPDKRTTRFSPIVDLLCQASGKTDVASAINTLADLYKNLAPKTEISAFLDPLENTEDNMGRALRDRAFLAQFLENLARKTQCIIVIEDLHWVDTASGRLLNDLVALGLPFLITARPEGLPDWTRSSAVLQLNLPPLGADDIRLMAEDIAHDQLSPSLSALIAEKAEGIPLVAEEIVHSLLLDARMRPGENGLELAADDAQSILTGNLEHLVISRVDQLPADERKMLGTASAIGRNFSGNLISKSLDNDVALTGPTHSLGLIEQDASGNWRFSHALIRDAIYNSLLTAGRQSAHLRVARAMEDDGDWPTGQLADHFARANMPEKAVPLMVKAAEESLNEYALEDVDALLSGVRQHIADDPNLLDDAAFRSYATTWLRALQQMGNFAGIQDVSRAVLPRLQAQGHSAELAIAKTITAISGAHTRKYAEGEKLAKSSLVEAADHGDASGAAWAKVALMRIYEETAWQPPSHIEKLAEEILPVARAAEDRLLEMNALYLLSSSYRSSGLRRKAQDVAETILKLSQKHNDKRALSFALWAKAIVFATEGNPEQTLILAEQALENAIPGSGDETVSQGLALFAHAFLRPPDEVRSKLIDLAEKGRAYTDYNIVASAEFIRTLVEFRAGHLALGWNRTNRLIETYTAEGNMIFTRQTYLIRAEIVLAVLGLIDPEAEAPSDRQKVPKARPGLADIALFARLKLQGKSLAYKDFETCKELDKQKRGIYFARCLIGQGLIDLARGHKEAASEKLTQGLNEARAEGLSVLEDRAEKGLRRVGR